MLSFAVVWKITERCLPKEVKQKSFNLYLTFNFLQWARRWATERDTTSRDRALGQMKFSRTEMATRKHDRSWCWCRSRNTNFLYDDINDGGWLSPLTVLIERQSARIKAHKANSTAEHKKQEINQQWQRIRTHTHTYTRARKHTRNRVRKREREREKDTNRTKIETKLNLKLLQRVEVCFRDSCIRLPRPFDSLLPLYD